MVLRGKKKGVRVRGNCAGRAWGGVQVTLLCTPAEAHVSQA